MNNILETHPLHEVSINGNDEFGHPKKFALIMLNTLRVCRFNTKEELNDAVQACKDRETRFLVLKYNHSIKSYTLPELVEVGSY